MLSRLITMTTTNKILTQEFADDLKKAVDWNRFTKLVEAMGNQCNSRKNRFDKADILEQAIQVYSNNRLEWVDGIGRDHHDNLLNLDIEFKFQNDAMFSEKTNCPKKNISIKIKNSLGETKKREIEDPADFYMFAQKNAVGIISYTDMLPYIKICGDGLMVCVPHDKMSYIISPKQKEKTISWSKMKKNDLIELCKKNDIPFDGKVSELKKRLKEKLSVVNTTKKEEAMNTKMHNYLKQKRQMQLDCINSII